MNSPARQAVVQHASLGAQHHDEVDPAAREHVADVPVDHDAASVSASSSSSFFSSPSCSSSSSSSLVQFVRALFVVIVVVIVIVVVVRPLTGDFIFDGVEQLLLFISMLVMGGQ